MGHKTFIIRIKYGFIEILQGSADSSLTQIILSENAFKKKYTNLAASNMDTS